MAREVLSNEELAALNAAASQQARPAAFWLLKIHICFLLSAGVGICTAFYPDFVVRWFVTRYRGRSGKPPCSIAD